MASDPLKLITPRNAPRHQENLSVMFRAYLHSPDRMTGASDRGIFATYRTIHRYLIDLGGPDRSR